MERRADRRHRHLLSRRGLRLPRQHRPPGGEGDRAPVRGVGHLGRQLLSRRHADQAAGAGLRRADAGARPRPPRPARPVQVLRRSGAAGPDAGRRRQGRRARARGGEGPSREFPHARLHHRVQIPRRRAALRSVLHQRLVQPLQLPRRDAEGRRGLCHLRLDGRRGLRQRNAVAFSHAAQRPAPGHAGPVGSRRAGQRLAVAGAGRARAAGAGRGAALLRRASGRPQHGARATRTRSTISPCMPRNGARPKAGRR